MGVTLNRDGSWEKHTDLIVAKAYKTLHYVMRNLKGSSRRAKELGYKSLVRPILEYATAVWDPYEECRARKIEKVQRKAARYVMGKFRKTDSVSEMLDILGWEKLEKRRKINRLGCIYRIIAGYEGWEHFENLLESPNFIGRCSHSYKIKLRKQRTNISKYSFLNRGIAESNKFPGVLFKPFPKNVLIFKKRCLKLL